MTGRLVGAGECGAGAGEDVEAEVAADFDPFVVLFGEHGADEADEGGAVGEDADDVGAAADLFVEPFLYPALGGGSTRCGSGFSGRGGGGGR